MSFFTAPYEKTFKAFSNPPQYFLNSNIDLYKYTLASMYEHGDGVEKDRREAESWYAKIRNKEDIGRCEQFINSIKIKNVK